MGSKKFTLNVADLVKIENALLVGGAAALTYVAGNLDQMTRYSWYSVCAYRCC